MLLIFLSLGGTPEKYLPFNLDIQISPVVGRVEQGKPAFVSGLTEEAKIVSIDGKNVIHHKIKT